MEMVRDQEAAEPIEERLGTADESARKEEAGTEETVEAEVPLVQKKRRLVKAGHAESAQKRVTAEATGQGRGEVDEAMIEQGKGEGTAVVGKEGQAALPLLLVPFEAVPEEE